MFFKHGNLFFAIITVSFYKEQYLKNAFSINICF